MPVLSPVYLRMKQAVQWLKHEKKMLQKDIAEKMGMTDVSFSRGMERIQHKYDEDFIIKFQQATDEIFSLDWLLNGTMPKFENEKVKEHDSVLPSIDQSFMFEKAIGKIISPIYDKLIASLEKQVADKDAQIVRLEKESDEKNELIKMLRARIHELEADKNGESFKDFPFPMGVSDKGDNNTSLV